MCTIPQVYRTSQPRNPISDIIRPDSGASTSIGSSKGGRSTEDLLGPIGSDLGLEGSEGDSLPSPSILDSATNFDFSDKEVHVAISEADLLTLSATPPLDLCWDLLCDVQTFQVCGRGMGCGRGIMCEGWV